MIRLDKKWLIFAVLMLVAQVLFAPLSCAADWPMFGHDPQHNSVAGESVEPPLKVQWESKTVSSAPSFLSMSGDTVYMGADYIGAECRNVMAGGSCAENILYAI